MLSAGQKTATENQTTQPGGNKENLLRATPQKERPIMSNTTSAIKGFMNFPTRFANGETIANEDGGPAFLQGETITEVTPATGALNGVKTIFKHTTAHPTRNIEVGEGERALVPLVTAWALTDMRDKVLVPGPIAGREGPAIIYKGLARFNGGKDMAFGGDIAPITFDPEDVNEIVNLTPHPVVFKRDGMDDLVIESSGSVRAEETFSEEPTETIDGIPVYDLSYTGKIIGLPDPIPGRIYIVSMIAAQAMLALCIERGDVVSPNYVPAIGGAPSVTLHI